MKLRRLIINIVVASFLLLFFAGCSTEDMEQNEKERILEKAILQMESIIELNFLPVDTNVKVIKKYSQEDYTKDNETWLTATYDESLLDYIDYTIIIGNENSEQETDECYVKLFYSSKKDLFITYSLFNSYSHQSPLEVILD